MATKEKIVGIKYLVTDKLKDLTAKQIKKLVRGITVRGVCVSRFYKGKWQDGKRKYRFKDARRDNPAAIIRDIFKKNGVYDSPGYDKEKQDRVLGQLYLYAEEKIDGFIVTEKISKYKPPKRHHGTDCLFTFKSASCGYKGSVETCDQKTSTCIELQGTLRNFGAFLGEREREVIK